MDLHLRAEGEVGAARGGTFEDTAAASHAAAETTARTDASVDGDARV